MGHHPPKRVRTLRCLHNDPLLERSKRSTLSDPRVPEDPLTVCIAVMFRYHYVANSIGNPTSVWGNAIVAAADRMYTNPVGDTAWEGSTRKLGMLGRSVMLAAGDIGVHSEVLRAAQRQMSDDPEATPERAAKVYGECMAEYRSRVGERLYLSPFGLDRDAFLEKQSNLATGFLDDRAARIESVGLNAEALIVGCGEGLNADIFYVYGDGRTSLLSDIGFSSIGIGAIHAQSYFMSIRYSYWETNFFKALYTVYAAKRRAESAPGVGKRTDYVLITRSGIENIVPSTLEKIAAVYDRTEEEKGKLEAQAIADMERQIASEISAGSAAQGGEPSPESPMPPANEPNRQVPKADPSPQPP